MVYVDAHQIRLSVQLNPSIKLSYVSRFHNHVTQVRLPRAGLFHWIVSFKTQYFYFF